MRKSFALLALFSVSGYLLYGQGMLKAINNETHPAGGASWSFVNTPDSGSIAHAATGTTLNVTYKTSVTVNTLCVIGAAFGAVDATSNYDLATLTDDVGTSYTIVTKAYFTNPGGNNSVVFGYGLCGGTGANTAHLTFNGSSISYAFAIDYAGNALSGFFDTSSPSGGGQSGGQNTPISSAALTTAASDELLVCIIGSASSAGGTMTFGAGTGFTMRLQQVVSGEQAAGFLDNQSSGAAGSKTCSATVSSDGFDHAIYMLTFKH